jgi:2-dehydropantoate 2-reductase
MKIVVMGAGGVGGFYGGLLAQAGEPVTFIARGAHLKALREAGLRVESQAMGDFHLKTVSATDDPAQAGTADLVLFATKAYDLERAAESLKPALGADTLILPLLNGIDIADRIAAVLGEERVLGGMCQVSSAIKEPGVIRQVGPLNRIAFGERTGGVSPRAQAVLTVLQQAGITAELSPNIAVDLWNKYLFITAIGGVCTVTGFRLGPVLADPDTRALLQGCMEEVHALAVKRKVPLKPTVVQDSLALCAKLPAETRPSLLLSLEQGGNLEIDALSGTAARLGREWGVPTPVNQFIYAALKLRANPKGG